MPVIKSAIKKLRRDKKREKENHEFRAKLETSIKIAKKYKNSKTVKQAFSVVDKAVKKNLIHKNKASKIKASLSKLTKSSKAASTVQKQVKKSPSKKISTKSRKKSK